VADGLAVLDVDSQLEAWGARATDSRAAVPTGWPEVDRFLRRGGFLPGTLVILGGRTQTRKTAVLCNWVVNMLDAGYPLGVVGLDESSVNYVAKIASAMFAVDEDLIEQKWDEPMAKNFREDYRDRARRLVVSRGYRPDFELLSYWLDEAGMRIGSRPEVVFVDYSSLMDRDRFAGGEAQRVLRLIEDLHAWTKKHDIVTVALHQVGRQDDNAPSTRYHGHTPMTAESLMYGGEATADIIFGTYRPANDPLGNMPYDIAQSLPNFNDEEYDRAVERVTRYQDSTFVQLLKNRPGKEVFAPGVEVKSLGTSQAMRTVSLMVDAEGRRAA
jgi:KaiC/GvpD/RAD55 family RecA-like ATPase